MVCRKYLLLLVLFLFCNTAFQGILNARTVTVAASNSSDPDKDSGSRSVDFYIWNVGTGIAMKSHYYNGSAFPVRPQKF